MPGCRRIARQEPAIRKILRQRASRGRPEPVLVTESAQDRRRHDPMVLGQFVTVRPDKAIRRGSGRPDPKLPCGRPRL